MNTDHSRPWYREPMVWLVIALPLSVVVAGPATLVALFVSGGIDSATDQVRRTAQIQVTDLGADRLALDQALHGELRIDPASGAIRLTLQAPAGQRPARFQLALTHPIDAARDRRVELVRAGDAWLGRFDAARDHDWQLELAPDDRRWRLLGRIRAGEPTAELRPQLARG